MPSPTFLQGLAGLSLAAMLLTAGAAQADDMGFVFQNEHDKAVAIELHGKDQVWPGGDKVYLLDAGSIKEVTVSCNPGEKICYGAWIAGNDSIPFGVGPDNNRSCSNCCYICVAHTMETIDLTP